MALNVSKHPLDDEISLSTDVFKFLQQDHNLLSQYRYRYRRKHFCCEVCSKSFSKENDLHYHRLDHLIDKPLIICDDPIDKPVSENDILPEKNEVCQTYNKIFTCARCNKHFTTISCLRIHQKFFHFECIPTSSCDHCGSHFKWKHHLAVHKYADPTEKISLCSTCNINAMEEPRTSDKCEGGEPSVTKSDIILDLSYTHQKPKIPISKKHVCHICRKEFSFKGNLSRHMLLIHTRKKIFSSKYSEKKYSKKTKVNTHTEIQAKKKSFICSICEKAFSHEGYLIRHLRLHSEGRLFCKVCHKAFFDNATLEQHLNIHFDEKSFVCRYCFKSFKHQHELDCHLQSHSHKKPFSCNFCDKSFFRKGYLATHVMRFHSTQRPA